MEKQKTCECPDDFFVNHVKGDVRFKQQKLDSVIEEV